MLDLGYLSATTALEAAKYFGKKLAGGAASALGARVVDWLRTALTSPSEVAALEKLAENPNSLGAQQILQGTVLSRLEKNDALAQSLHSLLADLPRGPVLTQNVSGVSNDSIQIAGDQNTILQSKSR